jgi:hypothetical protein
MPSPAKVMRNGKDSSPDSQGTDGSQYASPSTAPTNYSPAETHDDIHSAAKLIHQLNFMSLTSGGRQTQTGQLSDDPFVDARSLSATAAEYQPALHAQAAQYHTATFRPLAAQYQPAHRAQDSVRTSLAALNVDSTPDASSRTGRRVTLAPIELINAGVAAGELVSPHRLAQKNGAVLTPVRETHFGDDDLFSPTLQAQSSASMSPLSPRAKSQAIYGAFTSDPDISGSTAVTRYLALEHLDPIDADERHVSSKLPAFRQVRSIRLRFLHSTLFPFTSFHALNFFTILRAK